MELIDIKEKVLKDLEEIYNTQGISGFSYELRVSGDSIPTVYLSIDKIMIPEQNNE